MKMREEIIRARPANIPPMAVRAGKNGVLGHGVGGFVQLTTIERDGDVMRRRS